MAGFFFGHAQSTARFGDWGQIGHMSLSANPTRHPATERDTRAWPWPDFTPAEMACRHCGETFYWARFMQALQDARRAVGRPFHILSAHRCSLHNANIGGAPLSQHLKLAADIALYNHDRHQLYESLSNAGFTGFGFYSTFIHVDLGRKRHWFGSQKTKDLWQLD
jgi:hypothetical protein